MNSGLTFDEFGFHQLIIKQFVRHNIQCVLIMTLKGAFCLPAPWHDECARMSPFGSLYVFIKHAALMDVTRGGLGEEKRFHNFLCQLIIKSYDCVWKVSELLKLLCERLNGKVFLFEGSFLVVAY